MNKTLKIIGAAITLGLSACGEATPKADDAQVNVRPNEFALRPCTHAHKDPCTLAIAGGKRVLFGAPAGVVQSQSAADLSLLDAVVVFSLTASDLEGLDEVRNVSWHAGRSEPLLVIGPPGIEEVVTALNKAFEQSDALYVVEHGIPAGGYDAAVLTARAAQKETLVFDTGDLNIKRASYGYRIIYRAGEDVAQVALQDCGEVDELVLLDPTIALQLTVACDGDVGDYVWPLTDTVFIVESE